MTARRVSVCFNALFLQDHLGGIGNYALHLIRHVRRLRPEWDLTLLVHAGTAPHFRPLAEEGVRLLVKPIRGRTARLVWFHLAFPFHVGRFDLLHSVGNMGMALCPTRQVITIHDLYEQVSPERFSRSKRTLMKLLIAWSGARARAILTDSHSTHRDIGRYYPHLHGKTTVVHLGKKFPCLPSASPDGRAGFLFVGTLEPGKNLAHILRAFARFTARYAEGRLKVVGATGWGQSHLPGLLETLGVKDRVDFLGYVPDAELESIYASSLALVLASSYEGFGLPVIEAMARGCPVISARNSSLPEAGGDAALYFETGDIDALAARMEEVQRDRDLRDRCIRAGLAHAARFTWEDTAARSVEVFENALRP